MNNFIDSLYANLRPAATLPPLISMAAAASRDPGNDGLEPADLGRDVVVEIVIATMASADPGF